MCLWIYAYMYVYIFIRIYGYYVYETGIWSGMMFHRHFLMVRGLRDGVFGWNCLLLENGASGPSFGYFLR